MNTIHFTYDPLALVRIALQRHVEETIQGKFYKAKQFACYEYLRLMTDEVLEELLGEYVRKHNLEVITLSDWRSDASAIFEIINEKTEYQKLELDYKCSGFGLTGLGVMDRSDNTFYDCGFTHHWTTIREIIKSKYPELHEPLENMYFDEQINEYEGVTRETVESFIMDNFQLIGQTKPIHEYL